MIVDELLELGIFYMANTSTVPCLSEAVDSCRIALLLLYSEKVFRNQGCGAGAARFVGAGTATRTGRLLLRLLTVKDYKPKFYKICLQSIMLMREFLFKFQSDKTEYRYRYCE